MSSFFEKQDHIELTMRQLCVLGGLMGYQRLYGIKCSDTVCELHRERELLVKQTMNELVDAKCLTYGLDGRFLIEPHMYELIGSIGKPERMLAFSVGGKEKKYFSLIRKNDISYMVSEIRFKDSIRFYRIERFGAANLIKKEMMVEKQAFETDILLADLLYVRKCIRGFNIEIAERHLRKCVSDNDVCSELISLMTGTHYTVSVTAQYKTEYGFRDIGGFYVMSYKGGTLCAVLANNGYVHFSPVTYDSVCRMTEEMLENFFSTVPCDKAI